MVDKAKEAKGDERWQRQRHQHMTHHPDMAATIQPGRVEKILVDLLEGLAQEKDAKGAGKEGDDQRQVAILPAQV